jgi:hypothetical protein
VAVFSPDAKLLATTGEDDGIIALWEVGKRQSCLARTIKLWQAAAVDQVSAR